MKPHSAKSCPACGEPYEGDVLFCSKDGTPLANTRSSSFQSAEGDPYVGVELAGQIRIKHLIGIGSMGRVYRAFQAGIERDVAVKILHRELSGNAELVARFHREAKVASRLVHPNVVQVLMTGTVPFRPDPRIGGEMYLVMEHLDGISLLSCLAAAGNTGDTAALPLPRALHIVLQLCDAVGEAHAQGIVHRDLKPENVMLIRRGEDPDYVKVLDFGIARIDWANQSMATQAGLIFGTAKYISPEGAAGEGVGPAADVYSIATILYQCLAGRAPFEDESPVALLVQHTHAVPPELRSIPRASYVPAPIAEVVMQNLAKKPGARTQDARTFGRELVAAMRASGLDPEEIIAHSTLIVRGAVRLASHARTKSMDMTPELAKVIAQASKAPPLPSPPPLEGPRASPAPARPQPTLVDPGEEPRSAPSAATPVPALSTPAILMGVRATDTMVVDASELIEASPAPLPVPPPLPPPAPPSSEPEPAAAAPENVAPGGAEALPEAATSAVAESASLPEVATSAVAESAPLPEVATSAVPETAALSKSASAAPESASLPEAATSAVAESAPLPEVATSAVPEGAPLPKSATSAVPESAPLPAAATGAEPGFSGVVEDRASSPGTRPSNEAPPPMVVPVMPPPSLRTLFDAPAPEAVTGPPSSVAGGLAPVAPERPGGTQVGPSPFDGDSVDTSIPPLPARSSSPGSLPLPVPAPAPKAPPRTPDLDWSDDAKPAAAFQSTMQGTAVESASTSAQPPRERSRIGRVVAVLAIAAVAAISAVAFGRYFSETSAAESSGSLDDLTAQARECVRTRSWDSPPGANVRDITARALELSPNDKHILEIRREAAEKIVSEALGRKYDGDRAGALRLAKVALELEPGLKTAQGLVAEIDRENEAQAAAAGTASGSAGPGDVATGEPTATGKIPTAKPTSKPSLPPPSGTSSAKLPPSSVAPAKTTKPNTPPVNSGGPAVLPQPTSTGPWL